MSEPVAEIRTFNRFYTHIIGLLDEHLTDSPFSLPEARILYELASNDTVKTAADLSRILDMDTAQISRILARFKARQLVSSTVSTDHAKLRILSLTPEGQAAFAALDRSAIDRANAVLAPLDTARVSRLTQSMREIRSILGNRSETVSPAPGYILRAPRAGDLGLVVHRQAYLYNKEYNLDWTFEGLIAGIMSGFIANFDPAREQAWIADWNGSILCMSNFASNTRLIISGIKTCLAAKRGWLFSLVGIVLKVAGFDPFFDAAYIGVVVSQFIGREADPLCKVRR